MWRVEGGSSRNVGRYKWLKVYDREDGVVEGGQRCFNRDTHLRRKNRGSCEDRINFGYDLSLHYPQPPVMLHQLSPDSKLGEAETQILAVPSSSDDGHDCRSSKSYPSACDELYARIQGSMQQKNSNTNRMPAYLSRVYHPNAVASSG